ncbi:MAG: hypothetical protein GX640_04180 [Fibrobacter sp.]|nr:hypothetical protein [Fibrobacter sp.]
MYRNCIYLIFLISAGCGRLQFDKVDSKSSSQIESEYKTESDHMTTDNQSYKFNSNSIIDTVPYPVAYSDYTPDTVRSFEKLPDTLTKSHSDNARVISIKPDKADKVQTVHLTKKQTRDIPEQEKRSDEDSLFWLYGHPKNIEEAKRWAFTAWQKALSEQSDKIAYTYIDRGLKLSENGSLWTAKAYYAFRLGYPEKAIAYCNESIKRADHWETNDLLKAKNIKYVAAAYLYKKYPSTKAKLASEEAFKEWREYEDMARSGNNDN